MRWGVTEFQVGDEVRCIDSRGQESMLRRGGHYVVTVVSPPLLGVHLTGFRSHPPLRGGHDLFYAYRFQPWTMPLSKPSRHELAMALALAGLVRDVSVSRWLVRCVQQSLEGRHG